MRLTPITDARDSRRAFQALAKQFRQGSRRVRRPVGWHGGGGNFTVYWRPQEKIWALLERTYAKNRFWCCFGSENPLRTRGLTISCEINPPHSGINRRTAGVFLTDANGKRYFGAQRQAGRSP